MKKSAGTSSRSLRPSPKVLRQKPKAMFPEKSIERMNCLMKAVNGKTSVSPQGFCFEVYVGDYTTYQFGIRVSHFKEIPINQSGLYGCHCEEIPIHQPLYLGFFGDLLKFFPTTLSKSDINGMSHAAFDYCSK